MSQNDSRDAKSNKPGLASAPTLTVIPVPVERDRRSLAGAPTMAPPDAPPAPSKQLQTNAPEGATGLVLGTSEPGAERPDPASPVTIVRQQSGPTLMPGAGDSIGHYEIIREFGRGGMGAVFLARDTRLARRVAIKFLLTKRGAKNERFLAEARVTARCQHENIVIVHEIGEHREHPYIVLEHLQGLTLRQLIAEKPLSPQRAAELMVSIARALERAHEHGIVHRDLKPGNVFLTEQGTVKVLDFGIAKLLSELAGDPPPAPDKSAGHPRATPEPGQAMDRDPALRGFTRTDGLIGTVPYMSPEQMRCEAVDHRTDLWAAGVMLYEMVLGDHPLAPIGQRALLAIADGEKAMPSARERLPRIGELGAIIDRCLIADRNDRTATASELLAQLQSFLPERRALAVQSEQSPFAGLAAFQEADAGRFHGRAQDTASILTRLRSEPLLTVVGPSGTGKSSLIRAGVIPALRRSGEGWHALVIRPGRQPLAALADSLARLTLRPSADPATETHRGRQPIGRDELIARLQDEPGAFGAELRQWASRQLRRVAVFVDQLEELYTQGVDPAERIAFMRCLEGAADDATSRLRVIATMRSDFLERAIHDRGLASEAARGLVFLLPMSRVDLQQALTAPVEVLGYSFQSPALVDDMLDALQETPGALPLLQFCGVKLWETRDREKRLLTRASYDAMGGVAGALADHADAVLAAMTTSQRRLVRAVFERLVTPERTRAIATLGELCALPGDSESIEQIVHHLSEARLLAIEEGTRDNREQTGVTVELIHESLISSWPTLRRWLDENQDDAEFLARLHSAARQWHKHGRTDDLLWRGQAADDARRWLERWRKQADCESGTAESTTGALSARERDYVQAVVDLATRARRRRRQIAVAAFGFLSVVAIAVSVLAVRANRAAEHATSESILARNAGRMAAAREHQSDPTLVLALVREIEPSQPPKRWPRPGALGLAQRRGQRSLGPPGSSQFGGVQPRRHPHCHRFL